MSTTLYVHWGNHFITSDPAKAIERYLYYNGMSFRDYAVETEIVDYLDEDEDLRDEVLDECCRYIIEDISEDWDPNGWEIIERKS